MQIDLLCAEYRFYNFIISKDHKIVICIDCKFNDGVPRLLCYTGDAYLSKFENAQWPKTRHIRVRAIDMPQNS